MVLPAISEQEQAYANSCLGEKVDYEKVKHFIDTIFLPKLPFQDPVYMKCRFSNNNNSVDASVFHSDVYNYTGEEEIPLYTALCYLDKASMELIPNSHKKPNASPIEELNKTTLIELNPGDILVFNARMVHRGVNFSDGNRRLLQVFQIFPTRELYEQHSHKLITVDTSGKKSIVLYHISKIPWLITIVNMIVYWLHYYDIKYIVSLIDLPPWQKYNSYITYEPGGRVSYKEGLKDDINKNIIFVDGPFVKYSSFYFYLFLCIVLFVFRRRIGKFIKKLNYFK
jgi:hypothetical protein